MQALPNQTCLVQDSRSPEESEATWMRIIRRDGAFALFNIICYSVGALLVLVLCGESACRTIMILFNGKGGR